MDRISKSAGQAVRFVGRMARGERSVADFKRAIAFRQNANRTFVELEITSRCNTLCKCCERSGPLAHQVPTRESMSVAQVERVLHQYREIDPRGFCFSAGESLLHPEFFDIVALIRARFPSAEISLFSNGILLARDQGMLEQLMSSPVESITFSLHGARQETVSELQPGVKIDSTIAVAQRLLTEGNKQLCLNYVIQEGNLSEMCDFVDLAAAADLPMVSYAPMNHIGHTYEFVDYPALWSEWALQDRLNDVYRRAEALGVTVVRGFEACVCDLPADVVSATGELWACLAKQTVVGNVFDEPLPDLKAKQRRERRRLLQSLERDDLPAECVTCAVRCHPALR